MFRGEEIRLMIMVPVFILKYNQIPGYGVLPTMKQLAFLVLFSSLCSCMDFTIDQEEFVEVFADRADRPVSEEVLVDSNHVHFVHLVRGRPNLAVFIHGSPGSWSAFVDFFKNDTLLERYDLLAIDRPGFGYSDGGRPEPSLQNQAYQLQAVIGRFAHPNKVMIGHSLGGPVAVRIAMDYPGLTQAMVLVAPSIDPELERYEWYRSWIQTRAGGWFTPQDFWVSNEEILPLERELEQMLPLWRQVNIPTVVIQGTRDMLVPMENAEFARKMLPDSLVDIRYLEGVNHFIPWSHPQEMVKALMDLSL